MSGATVRMLLTEGANALRHIDDGMSSSLPALPGESVGAREAFGKHAQPQRIRERPALPVPSPGDAGGYEETRLEAETLLMHALRVNRAWLYAHGDDEVAPVLAGQFRCFVSRRAAGEPVAYIVGRREFFSLDLAVTPDVLIPRADTELLVELALARIDGRAAVDIADLGTGSGAIALALAHARPQARVRATDASDAALAVARGNAQRLRISNVTFALGDWCAALGAGQFDIIVSNPPYIRAADAHLSQGDLRFEPTAALASGSDGLDAIRAIAAAARAHLKPGGWLMLEHGFDQGPTVRDLLTAGGFDEVGTHRDLESRDRVTLARRGA